MVPLSAGQSDAVGGGLVPVGEGGNVEFPVGRTMGDPEGGEKEVVALPDADGTPVEGLATAVFDVGEVVIGTPVGAEDGVPVPVPTGVELLATGMLGDTPGELILIGPEDESVGGVDVKLPLEAGVLLEPPTSPRLPPLIFGLPVGPWDEELVAGVVIEADNPLEGDETGGTMVVPLPEGAGTDEDAGGAIGTPVVDGTESAEDDGLDGGGAIVVPLPKGAGVDEEDGRELGLRDPVENVGEGMLPVEGIVMFGLGLKVVGFTV